eukprot:gnl/MRDRNA2_/MRDRNA2_71503_c0_seq1.p1 gnl/MRDRNA2_/MRDRNA2_71503_c0~~gnl/MRDRNA2_/MRDRNA2_71503_c0_seq1.p1  ORF type:complete len:384 (-),score=64.22 gnl/MRDRNA2_/MRDRNA2_71503_c0_seq1:158-1309(-)
MYYAGGSSFSPNADGPYNMGGTAVAAYSNGGGNGNVAPYSNGGSNYSNGGHSYSNGGHNYGTGNTYSSSQQYSNGLSFNGSNTAYGNGSGNSSINTNGNYQSGYDNVGTYQEGPYQWSQGGGHWDDGSGGTANGHMNGGFHRGAAEFNVASNGNGGAKMNVGMDDGAYSGGGGNAFGMGSHANGYGNTPSYSQYNNGNSYSDGHFHTNGNSYSNNIAHGQSAAYYNQGTGYQQESQGYPWGQGIWGQVDQGGSSGSDPGWSNGKGESEQEQPSAKKEPGKIRFWGNGSDSETESEGDLSKMAGLEFDEDVQGLVMKGHNDKSGDSKEEDKHRRSATAEEQEEAQAIVAKACHEADIRNKMKEQAKTANRDQLQALLNQRFGKK